ncbi:hypothetical protein M426DRAFT_26651 [Hypoxylon sp. CI-4A]|nr:hypothetical protein M426DRAFT_26651 [Hypoxylon sp. CI-4A]
MADREDMNRKGTGRKGYDLSNLRKSSPPNTDPAPRSLSSSWTISSVVDSTGVVSAFNNNSHENAHRDRTRTSLPSLPTSSLPTITTHQTCPDGQSTRLSPGYVRNAGQYELYNPQTGRGWQRPAITTQQRTDGSANDPSMISRAPAITTATTISPRTSVAPGYHYHPYRMRHTDDVPFRSPSGQRARQTATLTIQRGIINNGYLAPPPIHRGPPHRGFTRRLPAPFATARPIAGVQPSLGPSREGHLGRSREEELDGLIDPRLLPPIPRVVLTVPSDEENEDENNPDQKPR